MNTEQTTERRDSIIEHLVLSHRYERIQEEYAIKFYSLLTPSNYEVKKLILKRLDRKGDLSKKLTSSLIQDLYSNRNRESSEDFPINPGFILEYLKDLAAKYLMPQPILQFIIDQGHEDSSLTLGIVSLQRIDDRKYDRICFKHGKVEFYRYLVRVAIHRDDRRLTREAEVKVLQHSNQRIREMYSTYLTAGKNFLEKDIHKTNSFIEDLIKLDYNEKLT